MTGLLVYACPSPSIPPRLSPRAFPFSAALSYLVFPVTVEKSSAYPVDELIITVLYFQPSVFTQGAEFCGAVAVDHHVAPEVSLLCN